VLGLQECAIVPGSYKLFLEAGLDLFENLGFAAGNNSAL
jgi:hypothetical protein